MESNLCGYPEKVNLSFPKMRLFSEFDSGNLADAVVSPTTDAFGRTIVEIFISRDCQGTPYANSYATWFYFGIELFDPSLKVCFTVMNSNNIKTLLSTGHHVAWKSREGSWQRLSEQCYNLKQKEAIFQYSFNFNFEKELVKKSDLEFSRLNQSVMIGDGETLNYEKSKRIFFFAFNYPWSYEDNSRWINSLMSTTLLDGITLMRSELCKSREKKEITLLTISRGITTEKRHIVLSSRIHPSETASSFVIKGLIEALISQPKFYPLLDKFVFKVVTMMNPDGVYRGYTRSNSLGQNLNRFFLNPSPEDQPEVYAFERLVASLTENHSVELFMDVHSNIKKDGIFLYGNSIEDFWVNLSGNEKFSYICTVF